MKDIFSALRKSALDKSKSFKDEDFTIRGFWKMDLAFKPNVYERTFMYSVIIAQTVGQGCCYCDRELIIDKSLIGSDARDIILYENCVSIAVLDSIFASMQRHPNEAHQLDGYSIDKTDKRNSIILKEIVRLLDNGDKEKTTIVNVGVVGNLIKGLKEKGYKVFATDLDKEVIGKSLHGVTVDDGSKTLSYVRDCSLAVVTGMTIATGSLTDIIKTAKRYNTKLLIFAETGANFGEEYCRTIGIDVVISEPFPFYIFQGLSRIEVYRKEQN